MGQVSRSQCASEKMPQINKKTKKLTQHMMCGSDDNQNLYIW